VATTAVVPVGLTRHRERLPVLRTLTADEACALVRTVAAWQAEFRHALGSGFVFLGDEVYLHAGAPVPPAADYEGFAIAEDGVGLVRRFEDGLVRALRRAGPPPRRAVTVVSGTLYAPRLEQVLQAAGWGAPFVRVVAVPNAFFGGSVSVAGLLTGQDIQRVLAAEPALGATVLVPAVALRDGDGVFLDDLTPADLARQLGVRVVAVEPEPRALLGALRR
jgi:NifB/MoaA-like Fe-S oxidoreductase